MKAFIKEELQEIKRCLKYMMKGGITPHSTLTIILNRKVQNMIDNYCEHEMKHTGHAEIWQCEKCGRYE